MSFSSASKEQISLKKLLGKAHTKNESEFYNESKSSGVSVNANTVFAEDIPSSPSSLSQNQTTNDIVEHVRLELTPLTESIQDGKYHAFSAALPATYEDNASHSKVGNGSFNNSTSIHSTQGKVQFVSDSAGLDYEVKVYNGGTDSGIDSGSRIPILDNRRWYFDYFNGVLFQQNPKFSSSIQSVTTSLTSGKSYQIKTKGNTTDAQWRSLGIPLSVTPEAGVSFIAAASLPVDVSGFGNGEVYPAENPEHIEAFLYIGKMASERFTEGSGGGTSVISDLSDVNSSGVSQDQILRWNGSTFIPSDDINTQLTNEQVQDIVGEMVSGSANSGISVTYADNNSAAGKLNFDVDLSSFSINALSDVDTSSAADGKILKFVSGSLVASDETDTNTQRTNEEIQDIVGEMVSGSTMTGINVTYADNNASAGKLDFAVDLSSFSINALTDVDTASISEGQVLKFNSGSLVASDETDTQLTNEQVQDIVGEMVSGSTNLGISITYADNNASAGKLNFTVDNTIARLADPAFTGIPTAPTADSGSNDTQIATTAFVNTELSEYVIASALSLNSLNDVSFVSGSDAQILVYSHTNDSDDTNDNWQNVTISGDATISNSGFVTITTGSISNSKINTPYIDILSGASTDRLNLGEILTVTGSLNEIEVSITNDVSGSTPGATLSIGLPDDVKVEGDLTVGGDLYLSGSATTIVTTNLDVTDSIISLNNGIIGDDPNNPVANPDANDIGLFFDRGALSPALFFWDEADDVFKLGINSGSIDSTANDLHDGNFGYSVLKIATAKNQSNETDLTSNDNTAATTEWTTSKIANTSINDLSNVVGAAVGKVLKFNSDLELVPEDASEFTADTSSLWAEGDIQNPNDPEADQVRELFPHGIIDGTLDTGMFAINLSAGSINYSDPNVTLHSVLEELSSMNAYTPSTRSSANIDDTFFEIYTDPNDDSGAECIRPKE